MTRKIAKSRIDGTDDFERPGTCVLMNPETLAQKRLTQGLCLFSTQMLLKSQGTMPRASAASG